MRLALIGHQAFAMLNFRGSLISGLVARGVEVFAMAPGMTPRDEAALRDLGAIPVSYSLERSGINPFSDVASGVQIFRALKAIRPDKVLTFTVKPVILGTLAAWLAGVPERYALIEGLGRIFVDVPGARHPVLQRLVTTLYRLALGRATRTLFLNRDDLAEFTAQRVVSGAVAEVIGGIGVDLEAWQQVPPVSDPLTFLFASRLLREKGVFEFLDAARSVRAQHPDVKFVVLGQTERGGAVSDGQMLSAVEEGLIEWPGHVPVQSWLRAASVFVLPSYYREGVPRSIQEAMAVGRAVITTDMPGCRDTVIAGENGLLVAPRNPDGLAEAMLAFVREPGLIERMGQRGRELAEERFDVNAATARTLAALGL
jgi:glycosyltransferase involved in cell wall biosynthesis